MPKKKYEEGYDKSPAGIAYRNQYRNEHYARVEINISPELRDRIFEQAKKEGLSRTQLITKAFTEYLDKQDG